MKIHPSVPVLVLAFLTGLLLCGCEQASDPPGSARAGHSHAKPDAPSNAESEVNRPWCATHECYEDLCFLCNAALRDPDRLWCREHSCYEDRCWECHPELRDPNRAFCDTHRLYEDECFLCRPELKPGASARASSQRVMCREHGVFEDECGICHPEKAAQLAPGSGMKVRLPSGESARITGVETALPSVGSVAEGIDCYAEISFNENRYARIVAPVAGIVQEVSVDLGSQIEEREVVARLWSATVAEAVAKAVLTHQTLDRERTLRAERVTSQRDLEEAEALHRAACQQLRTLGFTEEQIDILRAKPDESVILEVRAPFAGEIVQRAAVRGALVELGQPLFTVADRSTMWAILSIPESLLARVQVGQTVELSVDALAPQTFTGRLTWISAEVDERTRMAHARAEVPNPDGLLRAKMFARARILVRPAQSALLLPASAVQKLAGRSLVFVQLADDLYEARAIQTGARHQDRLAVTAGLQPQDRVVVQRSFALKSQLLLSRLGAGCVDD